MKKVINRILMRAFTASITSSTTSETACTEDVATRARSVQDASMRQRWQKLMVFVDGAVGDEVAVLKKWLVTVTAGSTVLYEAPLSHLAPVAGNTTPDGGVTGGSTEAHSLGDGACFLNVPSEEGSIQVSVRPAPYASSPEPGATVAVGVVAIFDEVAAA